MGKFFRRSFIVSVCTIISVFCGEIFSQPNYKMRVANGVKVNNNRIEFDVYIKSTGSSFKLTSYQCTFSFTQSIINNGNISFSYIPGTTQFSSLPPAVSIGILNNNSAYILTFASIPDQAIDEENITTTEKKVGRFRLSNSNSFIGDDFNILWCFNGIAPTMLTGPGFANITKGINHINLSGTSTFPLTISVENDWNLISVPGFHPINQNVYTWWINRDPAASVFNGSYQSVTTLEPGTGYWMKHIGDQTYSTGDEWPIEGMLYSPNYPIIGRAGWNLIGIYNYNLSVAAITTTPEGLQNGFVYGFSHSTGYSPNNNLTPGNGYLIFLTSAGLINLPDSGFGGVPKNSDYIQQDWGKITITDNKGKQYDLFAVNGDVNLESFHLPPVPPAGIFDIRYASGKFAEDLSNSIHLIEMSGIEHPLTIKVENISINLQDQTGKILNKVLEAGEEIIINSPLINKLLVSENGVPVSGLTNKLLISKNEIPTHYSLEQNYPNPFNPGTTIAFSVPEDVRNVKLTIYNALGQKIAVLVNSNLEPGTYSYYWDAVDAASGLYIYEFRTESATGGFVSTKKMMLLK